MLELLFELADDSIPKLEDKDTLDDVMLEGDKLELPSELVDDTMPMLLENKDELDGEVLLEPPPPHPTIIPPEMVKQKYRPIFDRII